MRPILVSAMFAVLAFPARAQSLSYDQADWQQIKQAKITLPNSNELASILLLKSWRSTGASGAGLPMNDVDLIVVAQGKVIYRFATGRKDERYFMDDLLEVRSITGQPTPEILCHSGIRGMSDSREPEHILRYAPSKATFVDISPKEFENSSTHQLRWLLLRGQTLAVVADRNWRETTPVLERCHQCSSPFLYDIYAWDRQANVFVAQTHIDGTKDYSFAVEALDGDWKFIQSELSRSFARDK